MAAVLALMACTLPRPALAADRTWDNTGFDYNDGASWTGGIAPTSSDAALFNVPATTQPNLSASLTNQQVRFSTSTSSGYTLSANPGASLTLTNTSLATGAALSSYNTSGTNTISAPIILGAAAGSTQNVSMANGGVLHVSGNISELNSGITLQLNPGASNVIRLSGSNSFTGGLTVNPGGGSSVLELGSAAAIPTSGTFTLLQNNSLTIRPSGATTRTIAMPFAFNTTRRLTFARDAALSTGATVFSGTGTLGANTDVLLNLNNAVVFERAVGETGGSRNFTQSTNANNAVHGYVFLMAANTWSGTTALNSASNFGTSFTVAKYLANANTADSLGSNTGANTTVAARGGALAGSVIRYIGGQSTSNRNWDWGVTTSSNPLPMSFDASGSGALTLNGTLNPLGLAGTTRSGTLTFDGVSTAANTFASVIANPTATAASTTAISKVGLATWVLSGANTFTGGISLGFTDGPSSGKLVLDYATSATVVSSSNNVSLGGGMLEFKAHPTNATTQTLGNITLPVRSGGVSKLVFTRPGSATLAVTTGTVSRSHSSANGANALFIDNTAGATLSGTMLVNVNSGVANGLARWAVVSDASGTGFLTESAGSLVRYTAATPLAASSNSSTTNFQASGDTTLTSGNKTYSSLAVDTTGGGTLTVFSTGTMNPSGALLFTGNGNFTIADGTVFLGNTGDNYIHQYSSGVATISSVLSNGFDPRRQFAKTGPGTLELSGVKDFNGSILIMEGALRASNSTVVDPATFAANQNIQFYGGVLELGVDNYTATIGTADGNVGWRGSGGFSAFGANRTVSLNSGASLVWGSANFVPANNAFLLGGRDSNAKIDFQNPLDFGFQQRVVQVQDGVSSSDVDARLSGVLSGNYGGGLIKDGAGGLELTAANTYLGETWVRAGRLAVDGSIASSAGVMVWSGAELGGTGTVAAIGGAGVVAPGNSPGILTAPSASFADGLDFAFEFAQAGGPTWSSAAASGNDVLRLTSLTAPLVGAATAANVFDIYFLEENQTYLGGIFTDQSSSFESLISDATFNYFVRDPSGLVPYKGFTYSPLSAGNVTRTTVQVASADFAGGSSVTNGYTMQFVVVPEPATTALAAVGIATLAWACRRRKAA